MKKKQPFEIVDVHGKKVKITILGSLGLLALGYKGLMAWRIERRSNLNTLS
ncbi:hypothetical protein [Portibacter marinus]|uniref:hypothetical protein n=1 Tax=Portibacter marinus TaxID=2898660 RepID=UPI001F1D5D06|nr:hypothetical protein [Portibacter marinus]